MHKFDYLIMHLPKIRVNEKHKLTDNLFHSTINTVSFILETGTLTYMKSVNRIKVLQS